MLHVLIIDRCHDVLKTGLKYFLILRRTTTYLTMFLQDKFGHFFSAQSAVHLCGYFRPDFIMSDHNLQIYNVQTVCKTDQRGHDSPEGAFKCRVGSLTRSTRHLSTTRALSLRIETSYRKKNGIACFHGQVALG
jgi:hypothetical protein